MSDVISIMYRQTNYIGPVDEVIHRNNGRHKVEGFHTLLASGEERHDDGQIFFYMDDRYLLRTGTICPYSGTQWEYLI